MSNTLKIVLEPQDADDEDFIRCMEYITLREVGTQVTKTDIAKHFGIDRSTLHQWILKWEASGLLRRCRMAIMVPMAEEIRNAEDAVLRDWPEVLEYARTLATGKGRSEKVASEVMQWLHEAVIKPRIEAQEESGAEELGYLETISTKAHAFDPLTLEVRKGSNKKK